MMKYMNEFGWMLTVEEDEHKEAQGDGYAASKADGVSWSVFWRCILC